MLGRDGRHRSPEPVIEAKSRDLLFSAFVSIGRNSPLASPFADGRDFFRASHAERLSGFQFGNEDFRAEFLLGGEGGVQPGGDALLDFTARKAVAGGGQLQKVERLRIAPALL